MGRALAEAFAEARATFEEADAAFGGSLSGLCFDGPEDQLTLTEHTQPAILTVSTAAARVLAKVVAEAKAVERKGMKVDYLNIGDPIPFGFRTPPALVEVVARAMPC